jgi:glycosyltransferase involved in cell wall biosynthesis
MFVQVKQSADWRIIGPSTKFQKLKALAYPSLAAMAMRLQVTTNPVLHSPSLFSTRLLRNPLIAPSDIINLHWTGQETISIEEVGMLPNPLVCTIHDMWAFCGAEHYVEDNVEARYRTGYSARNRRNGSSGLDIDRWVWGRKQRNWRTPFHVVAPSRWLAQCARQSVLMKYWPITVIPNPLDVQVFRPLPRDICRSIFKIPNDVPVIMFGALGGSTDPRKGFDLLVGALHHLQADQRMKGMHCLVVGQSAPRDPPKLAFPIHWVGQLHDDFSMAAAYACADVVVIPSRIENLPQAATEAQACGVPIVAFDAGGIPDTVEHKVTGYLAQPYSIDDFAEGIRWIMVDGQRRAIIGDAARIRAIRLWAADVILTKYTELYDSL